MTKVPHVHEPRWHASIAVITAVALYVTLPNKITFGPLWLLPLIVALLLIPLLVINPQGHEEVPWQRALSIVMIGTLNVANLATLILMLLELISSKHHVGISGPSLLLAAVQIWLTNVIVYGLWYWEIDGGGPRVRSAFPPALHPERADLFFPQMALPADHPLHQRWRSTVMDYIYAAFTFATALSPADTYPVTGVAKTLMMAEALTSLLTLAVIASRAINILS